MATGRQAGTALTATVWSAVYQIPTGFTWTGVINFCNRNATQARIRLAYSPNASPAAGEYVEFNTPLAPAGNLGSVLERTSVVLQAGHYIHAYSDSNDVDVVVMGIEE